MTSSFLSGLNAGVTAGVCALLREDDDVIALLRRVGMSDNAVRRSVEGFRRILCSDPSIPQFPNNNFTGGQCQTNYTLTAKVDRYINSDLVQSNQSVTPGFPLAGKIQSVAILPDRTKIRVVYDDGALSTDFPSGSGPAGTNYRNLREIVLTRVDGLPDNCGNVGGGDGNNNPPPLIGPINFQYNDIDAIIRDESGQIRVFAPIMINNGTIEFPVEVNLGGLTIEGNLNLDGKFVYKPPFPPGIGTEDDPIPPEVPPEEPPATERRIIGAKVYVISNSKLTTGGIMQGENPDILIPRAGSIQFYQDAGSGRAWSPDIDVKTAVAWIPCPPPGYAYKVAGTPQLGVTWEINPVYERPE